MIVKNLSQFNAIPAEVRSAYSLGITKSLYPGRYPRLKPKSPNIIFALLGFLGGIDIDRLDFLEMKGLLGGHLRPPNGELFELNNVTLRYKNGRRDQKAGELYLKEGVRPRLRPRCFRILP